MSRNILVSDAPGISRICRWMVTPSAEVARWKSEEFLHVAAIDATNRLEQQSETGIESELFEFESHSLGRRMEITPYGAITWPARSVADHDVTFLDYALPPSSTPIPWSTTVVTDWKAFFAAEIVGHLPCCRASPAIREERPDVSLHVFAARRGFENCIAQQLKLLLHEFGTVYE